MKTNFTMTKRLLLGLTLLAVVATSCSDDDPIPGLDITGQYELGTCVLVDGNQADANETDLVIFGGSQDATTVPPYTAIIPAGANGAQGTTFFVNEVLKGASPCEGDDSTLYTYQVDFQSGGKLEFICTSEGNTTTTDLGTYVLSPDEKTLTLTISSAALGTVVISITDLVVASNGALSGNIDGYPMVVNAQEPIGLSNIQFINFDVELNKQ